MFQKIKNFFRKCNENIIPLIIILPIFEILIIECLHRRSVKAGFLFIIEEPFAFFINVALLMSMLSVCLLFRERLFWAFLFSLLWLILGIANCVILGNRVSPLSFNDVKVFSSVASIIRQYMGIPQIAIAIVFLGFCTVVTVYLRKRIPRIDRRKHLLRDMLFLCLFMFCGVLSIYAGKRQFKHTGNITITYLYDGFVYCFTDSVINTGIEKPIGYSEQRILTIRDSLKLYDTLANRETDKKPNVIFVQLESFFDVNNMRDYSYSEDPMPNFHRLIENYSSGLLTVPAFGAGTVNTEFEVLTGMSIDYFALCEYPYKTILKEQTCESMAYNLEEVDYATAVIHNNRGTFYSRNQVFKHLGFDVFDSVEYMNNLEYNSIGWVKDSILTNQIIERIKSTPQKDFIYTITVQTHGKYPTEAPENPYPITLNGEKNIDTKNAFEYYINECHETDLFIQDLITQIQKTGEDTIIVFFGDHLPTLDITDSKLQYQNTYQTTYVIWDNIGLEQKDKNLYSYQLSSHIMKKLGYSNGIFTRFHQSYVDNLNYEKYLNLLEYDMLFGKKYIYGEVDRYDVSQLQLGLYPITIKDVRQDTDSVVVTGEHFTESSCIFINGHKQETNYIDENTLITYGYELTADDRIRIRQITSTGGKIGSTDEWIYSSQP
ncbi:MAG: sulfatase-like hydrolase/transferase [Lachnospiraceae bacterium]|nr:sulfatase-like hydrolase/transferase [Lachnospiraceae bacterium]